MIRTLLLLALLLPGAALASRTLEAGRGHNLAVTPAGEVWGWGMNDLGELGNATTTNSSAPVRAGTLTNVIAVAAGGAHSVALRSDATVWTWGVGSALGVTPPQNCTVPDIFSGGTYPVACSKSPVQVGGLTGITAIAAGGGHVIALRSDGTLRAWGANASGQLGDGTTTARTTPVTVTGIGGVIAIAAGDDFTLALKSDGTVWAWGMGAHGELGLASVPQTCAGYDPYGSSPQPCARSPSQVAGLTGVTAISAKGRHSLALKSDQSVWAWGSGRYGQMGDGTQSNRNTPYAVQGMSGAARIVAGFNHSIVVKTDGAYWAFGLNNAGQLGFAGSGEECLPRTNVFCRKLPVRVVTHDGAINLVAGGGHTVTVRPNGAIVAFGLNISGQLGTGLDPSGYTSLISIDPHAPFSAGTGSSGTSLGAVPSSGGLNLNTLDDGVAFTSTGVGIASASRQVTFTNLQPTAVTITSITTSGNFSRTHDCPASLPGYPSDPGNTCSIFVTFTPTGTGERTGTLTVATNAPDAPSVSLDLSGFTPGVNYELTAAKAGAGSGTLTSTPSGISCGTTCVLSFASGAVVSLGAAPAIGSTFAGWDGACTGTGACSVTMNAAATVRAAFNLSTPPGGPTANPTALWLGGQSINTNAAPRTVTITNPGASSMTISSITAPTHFTVSHNCGVLTAGASCTATVGFAPTLEGSISGALAVASSAGALSVALAGTGERSLVTHYYRSILRRDPDAGGKVFWENEAVRVANLGANVNETWFAMAQAFYFSAEYAAFNRNNTAYATDLYNTFFNRAPDSGGLSFWVGQLNSGMPREVALASFMFSAEFNGFTAAIFGATAARAETNTVVDFYRGLLSRLPDGGGFNFWVGRFRTAQCQSAAAITAEVEAISSQFALSGEYAGRARTNAQYIGDLYNAFLRRGGDLGGVQFWIGQLSTRSRESIRVDFKNSPEFQGRVNAIIAQGCL